MQVYATEAIRNVALLSHSGAGKTSLAEAMLVASGALNRLGDVEEGTTAADFEPEEIERSSSIQTAIVPSEWKDVKVNILDTPGYADFDGEVLSALAAADCALVVVSAVDGVEVGTEVTWNGAADRGLPRIVLVNKMDRDNADFYQVLDAIRSRFGRQCVPVLLPIGAGDSFSGVINLLDPSNADQDPRFGEFREQLVEAAAETDDALTEKYLDEGDLTPQELASGLKAGVLAGTLFPVLASSATKQIGITELLDFLVEYAPSPADRGPVAASGSSGDAVELSPVSGNGPVAFVFKTSADPYVGKLSFFRVVAGTMKSDSHFWNANKEEPERFGQLFVPRGKAQESVPSLEAGDIGAVAKLQHTSTGDTICLKESAVTLPAIEFPGGVYSVAIAPKTKADMDKMGAALNRLVEEDPTLRVTRDQETGETLLSSMGEAHIDVAAKKLKRKFGVDVLTDTPRVPYRETITGKANAEYKHKKQTGGHGQYGHVCLELEPLPRGTGIEFTTRVSGGAVPREYFPAVEKGVKEAVVKGALAGSRVVDVKVTLYDGSSHPVDSSGMAFQIAGSQAFKKGLEQANPVILEPIMRLNVTVPDSYTGDVVGDLNAKRSKVLGMNPEGGLTSIEVQVPLAEVQRYATDLRSMTQGRGRYAMEFSHYEQVPAHLAQKIAAEVKQD